MTTPAYPFDATTLAAIQRMGAAGGVGSYNSNGYDIATNPLGFALGGHRLNFPAALADEAQVAAALALAAQFVANAGAAIGVQNTSTLFTATAGQTTFTVTYTAGFVDVFINGALLMPSDYTATNGTSVVLAKGAKVGDAVFVRAYVTGMVDAIMVEKSAGYTMANRDNILARTDTAGGTIALLLPATPTQGYENWVGQIGGFSVTVGLNGSTGSGAFSGSVHTIAANSGAAYRYIYTGGLWRVKSDGVLT